jgi:hypothetical protein
MAESLPSIDVIREQLERVLVVAEAATRRAAVDRDDPRAALQAVTLGLLGMAVAEAHCIAAALRAPMPQGTAPNVRAMLEVLVTVEYLNDDRATEEEAEDRLDRYYRGVRREQVRLRSSLDAFPVLKATFVTDQELAERERLELQAKEAGLPDDRRLKRHWSRAGSLQGMAEAVGLGSDYAVQYRVNSGSAHGNRPWDMARVDERGLLICPDLDRNRDLGVPHGFDAQRYLAWTLSIAHANGTVALYESEQVVIGELAKYRQSLETLVAQGVVGAGLVAPPSHP